MPFHLGPWEIGLILLIILIVFGVGKLPRGSGFCIILYSQAGMPPRRSF